MSFKTGDRVRIKGDEATNPLWIGLTGTVVQAHIDPHFPERQTDLWGIDLDALGSGLSYYFCTDELEVIQ